MATTNNNQKLPILVLKNVVAFPKKIIPVKVGRAFTIKAIEKACKDNSNVFVVTQIDLEQESPTFNDVYKVGVIARVIQSISEKDGSLKVLVEGIERAKLVQSEYVDGFLIAITEPMPPLVSPDLNKKKALIKQLQVTFNEYILFDQSISQEIIAMIKEINDLESLVDILAVQINLTVENAQIILQEENLEDRATKICAFMLDEIEVFKTERNIKKRVLKQIEKHQKDYYLNEQMRAIYRELGREDGAQEIEALRNQAKQAKLPKEAMEKVLAECKKLEMMQSNSPEAVVSRNYVDWIVSLPWHKKTKDSISIIQAQKILDQSHFGMKKVKEHIIEFIAAKKFAGENLKKSPIICLVGPPGVGKTSLAKTIAAALERNFARISLGGLKDEAEIRGHRRTYIGATVGKIIGAMKKVQSINPVILLDEIDKMSMDLRGDPSAALLEALDVEQNKSFTDHFLEIGYDLSRVMFIATANLVDNIPYPLLDRMEIVQLSGYTTQEKLKIVQKFILENIKTEYALGLDQIDISEQTICNIIEFYTREAGVRQLTRILSKIIRQGIVQILSENKESKLIINDEFVKQCLGAEKYKPFSKSKVISVGTATGLAWTEVGGDVLEIETCLFKGKGALTLTGQLGEVMQESAQAALSFIRSQEKEFGLKPNFYSSMDIHIHIPEGATPKDGPSAGITIASALISALTKVPVIESLAMTGEITLRGKILPVGGLKDKILAAIRYGMEKVLIPFENKAEVELFLPEIIDPKDPKRSIEVVYVNTMKEAIEQIFGKKIKPFKHSKTSDSKPTEKNDRKKKVKTKKPNKKTVSK